MKTSKIRKAALPQDTTPRDFVMPVGQRVQVKFPNWKYYRYGIIKFDKESSSYIFHQEDAKHPFRQISSADPPSVILEDGSYWNFYQ